MNTAELPLANRSNLVSLVDADDLAQLRQYRWIELGGYVVRQQRTAAGGTVLIYLHRYLMQARPHEVVDHINNDRLDNRRSCNLRRCSQSENLANRPSPRPDGYRGVYFEKRGGRWRAQISVGGKNAYLGTYATPELAAVAYDRAARKAFGRFARLNFPGVVEEEQLELPGLDPFDAPAPGTRIDFAEIAQERRWREARALPIGQFDGQVDDCGIAF